MELRNVFADLVTYRGRQAVRITHTDQSGEDSVNRRAMLKGTSYEDSTVDIDLANDTKPDGPANVRGFVGIAFRVAPSASERWFSLMAQPARADR